VSARKGASDKTARVTGRSRSATNRRGSIAIAVNRTRIASNRSDRRASDREGAARARATASPASSATRSASHSPSEPERQSGRRRYPPSVLRQLAIIDAAQRVGFSLDEIRDLVWSRGDPAHERLRQLALRKLPGIDRLIERATAVRRLLEICSVCTCRSITECRLLDDPMLPLAHPPADQALERRIAREAPDAPVRP
jgi:DNA-binding transcriptional MerR regulator